MNMSYKYNKKSKIHELQRIKLHKRTIIQMETLQHIKYLKWINELQSNNGHMQHLLNNYKVIYHTLTLKEFFYMIIPMHVTYSPTYPSVETADMHHYLEWRK